ncbi:MAG: multicopper oxidase domain-containing protein [Desulfofustis sp.]|jgi:FtsP/CotA-like multicopper oxidase with cupredoxin domain|nr:multicopper oxidase domain-containing protein [Desulfofustis sp.]
MKKKLFSNHRLIPVLAVALLLLSVSGASAGHTGIDGITGTTFNLAAKADHITTADGGNYLIWGYADQGNNDGFAGQRAQYPGPTLIVKQGQTITVTLTNHLPEPTVSIIFPGQEGVTAIGGTAGLLTQESTGPGVTVTYSFVASKPGTYMYHSGSNMAKQLEMGLMGALIVRPSLGDEYAYNHEDTRWDREYLILLSEMDYRAHDAVEFNKPFNDTDYFSVYWFINGRVAPDNMAEAFVPWLPTQPYNNLPRMHPGEKLLMRVINAGRDLHPFHHHGNHARIIARDGRMLSSDGLSPDLAESVFTIKAVPGQTVDAIFEWTGEKLGWDIYGTPADGRPDHDCIDGNGDGYADPDNPANNPYEFCEDHGEPCIDNNDDGRDDTTGERCKNGWTKAFPTILPEKQDLAFGGWYGGSPFLGGVGDLPPGEGGLNPNGGFSYMWHSHTEKELTNFDIFPGGMLTMLIIEAWNVDIP